MSFFNQDAYGPSRSLRQTHHRQQMNGVLLDYSGMSSCFRWFFPSRYVMIGRSFVVHDERTVSIGGKIEYVVLVLILLNSNQYVVTADMLCQKVHNDRACARPGVFHCIPRAVAVFILVFFSLFFCFGRLNTYECCLSPCVCYISVFVLALSRLPLQPCS